MRGAEIVRRQQPQVRRTGASSRVATLSLGEDAADLLGGSAGAEEEAGNEEVQGRLLPTTHRTGTRSVRLSIRGRQSTGGQPARTANSPHERRRWPRRSRSRPRPGRRWRAPASPRSWSSVSSSCLASSDFSIGVARRCRHSFSDSSSPTCCYRWCGALTTHPPARRNLAHDSSPDRRGGSSSSARCCWRRSCCAGWRSR